jgi:wyosine [tRNA(Phe)-imidazoG37] synthetase (radical SAM superfamily)
MKMLLGLREAVDRDDVIWCYRTFLGREPESEDVLARHLKARSLRALVQVFVTSDEFRSRSGSLARLQAPSPDGPTSRLVDPKSNEALAMAEYKAGVLHVNSTPRMLTLETTSRCNLRCVMCPHAIDAVDRPKHLEEDSIGTLWRFLGQARSVQLHGIGEPLASPAFWKSLQYIPAGCDASINTNLTVLDDKRLERLVASNLSVVNVSLDAAAALTYRRIRGFEFETVLENIRRLVAARAAAGRKLPRLYMNMTMMRSNVEEVPAFVDLAADLKADRVCLWHLNRWPDAEMRRYRIEREGWRFDYASEGLWNHPQLSNQMVREAQTRAAARGIGLYLDENKHVFFDEPAEAAA